MQLASTIGHELIHVTDVLNNNMTNWFKRGGEEYRSAKAETNAYDWVIKNGGYYDIISRGNHLQTLRLYDKLFNNFR